MKKKNKLKEKKSHENSFFTSEKEDGSSSSEDDDDSSNSSSSNSISNNKNENTRQQSKTIKKNKSKHAPTTTSSLRSAFFSRGAPNLNASGIGVEIGANRYKPRDPRTQTLSGHHDQDVFETRYQFLEKMQETEIETLKKRIKVCKMKGKKGQTARRKLGIARDTLEKNEAELEQLVRERSSRKEGQMIRAARRSVKKKMMEDVAEGKRGAYYLKRKVKRQMEQEAKVEELRKRSGDSAVDKYIAKKRKKKMAKDSSLMPNFASY
mmetsp:Transcript_22358/g.31501  ORF Transcript_22358/g.31501 Transcript_22358/m.31501 type:complete len:265 (-) Transcript_22358:143-937(-)